MMNLNCQHFTQQQCRSCQWLEKDKFEQISLKEEELEVLRLSAAGLTMTEVALQYPQSQLIFIQHTSIALGKHVTMGL